MSEDDSAKDNRDCLFQVQNLAKTYSVGEGQVHALRGVNLKLFKGELIVLLGASGSGKSTLLNILGGLDVPSQGQVFYQGQNLGQYSESELTDYRRRHVGFVFQFYNLIPSLTAKENVAVVAEISPDPMSAEQALEQVQLLQRQDHFPAQLSGGEQQRVAIARAVCKRPAILLCDEPTGALDSATGVIVLDVLARVNQQLGTTVVLITHNAAISAMADRIIYFSDGHISKISTNSQKLNPSDIQW